MRTAAVARRAASTLPDRSGHFGPARLLDLLAGAAEAALALAVGLDREVERRGVEIRPERLGEVELRVRELPEEEVADALLPAGADEQVRLGRIAHREVPGEVFLAQFPERALLRQPAERLEQVPAPAVVRGDRQGELAVVRGQPLALLDQLPDL